MKPYFQDGACTIYCGDCREILPTIKADCVVTDPPYGVGFRGEAWDEAVPAWWLELARAAAPLVVFTTAPTTIWDYPRADWVLCAQRPASSSRTPWGGFNHWSPVLVYGRGKWSPDCHSKHALVTGNENESIGHPCPKSLSLMRWIVLGTTGDVLDPFMGSGTTLRAAKDLGRKSIGIEISEAYCEVAAKRLQQEVFAFEERKPNQRQRQSEMPMLKSMANDAERGEVA